MALNYATLGLVEVSSVSNLATTKGISSWGVRNVAPRVSNSRAKSAADMHIAYNDKDEK